MKHRFDKLISKSTWIVIAVVILAVVTIADYVSGFELSFAIFYLISVFITAWKIGWKSSLLVSMVSATFSLAGDLASGADYSSSFVPWWNMAILFFFYMSMVVVVVKLRSTQDGLENRVVERTRELQREISERVRLERALLDVSEREQRRIGHDLHDSLCQHLTGTALAAQVLAGELEAGTDSKTADASKLVEMIEQGIDLSRSLARGMAPVELDASGLLTGLRELGGHAAGTGSVEVNVQAPSDLSLENPQVTTQLFRIAQEAVRNAAKHSEAKQIQVSLTQNPHQLKMTISDNGGGLKRPREESAGMGLHIMRYRASMIGARLEIVDSGHGVTVTIHVPVSPL